jgi:hypothetical protein
MEDIIQFDSYEDAVASWVAEASATEEISVWVAPSHRIKVKIPKDKPPSILIGRLLRDEETGKFWFKPMNWPFLIRTVDAPRRLGLPFEHRVLLRLIHAGFVKGCRITTYLHLVDVESLWQHMQNTSGVDGELWWTPHRRELFAEAVSVVRSARNGREVKPTLN